MKPKGKISVEDAKAMVEAWKVDAKSVSLGDDVLRRLNDLGYFIPYAGTLRGIIGNSNKLASNALWDGQYDAAVRLLCNHGLCDVDRSRIQANSNATYSEKKMRVTKAADRAAHETLSYSRGYARGRGRWYK